MTHRGIAAAVLALAWIVVSVGPADATVTTYIDSPRNEFSVAVNAGVHAWSVDSAAHPYVYRIWVKPTGGPAYPVSALTSSARVGNIDLANPTFGDVLSFSSGVNLGRRQQDIKLWDLADREPLAVPAGINTPDADEARPSISGDYLLFERIRPSGADRLLLYRLSTQTLTSIAATTPQQPADFDSHVSGDYVVYHVCSELEVCNVFRRRISTATTVEAPNPGRANYSPTVTADGTVYYVQGSSRFCGHHSKIMRWTGGGSATLLAALPETIEAGVRDAYDNGGTTTVYFTRLRCRGYHYGIYQLPGS